MPGKMLKKNFYDRIKPRLYRRIGHEVRLAGRVLDLGCGACELVQYLAQAYGQHVTGVDISSADFPKRRRSSGDQACLASRRRDPDCGVSTGFAGATSVG